MYAPRCLELRGAKPHRCRNNLKIYGLGLERLDQAGTRYVRVISSLTCKPKPSRQRKPGVPAPASPSASVPPLATDASCASAGIACLSVIQSSSSLPNSVVLSAMAYVRLGSSHRLPAALARNATRTPFELPATKMATPASRQYCLFHYGNLSSLNRLPLTHKAWHFRISPAAGEESSRKLSSKSEDHSRGNLGYERSSKENPNSKRPVSKPAMESQSQREERVYNDAIKGIREMIDLLGKKQNWEPLKTTLFQDTYKTLISDRRPRDFDHVWRIYHRFGYKRLRECLNPNAETCKEAVKPNATNQSVSEQRSVAESTSGSSYIDPITNRRVFRTSMQKDGPSSSATLQQDSPLASQKPEMAGASGSPSAVSGRFSDLGKEEIEALTPKTKMPKGQLAEFAAEPWLVKEGFKPSSLQETKPKLHFKPVSPLPIASVVPADGILNRSSATQSSEQPSPELSRIQSSLDRMRAKKLAEKPPVPKRPTMTEDSSASPPVAKNSQRPQTSAATASSTSAPKAALQYKYEENRREDIDLLRASDVRASAGRVQKKPAGPTPEELRQRRIKLEQSFNSSQAMLNRRLYKEFADALASKYPQNSPLDALWAAYKATHHSKPQSLSSLEAITKMYEDLISRIQLDTKSLDLFQDALCLSVGAGTSLGRYYNARRICEALDGLKKPMKTLNTVLEQRDGQRKDHTAALERVYSKFCESLDSYKSEIKNQLLVEPAERNSSSRTDEPFDVHLKQTSYPIGTSVQAKSEESDPWPKLHGISEYESKRRHSKQDLASKVQRQDAQERELKSLYGRINAISQQIPHEASPKVRSQSSEPVSQHNVDPKPAYEHTELGTAANKIARELPAQRLFKDNEPVVTNSATDLPIKEPNSPASDTQKADINATNPSVRRCEPVFSGTRRSPHRNWETHTRSKSHRRAGRRWARFAKFFTHVTLVLAAAYLVLVAAYAAGRASGSSRARERRRLEEPDELTALRERKEMQHVDRGLGVLNGWVRSG